jgi:hypothetical protein
LHLHSIIININTNEITISACKDLITPISVYCKGNCISRKVLATKLITIPLKTIIAILAICALFLKGRNYIFEGSFTSARDAITNYANFVAITNFSNKLKKVPTKVKLSIITKYKEDSYYQVKELKLKLVAIADNN